MYRLPASLPRPAGLSVEAIEFLEGLPAQIRPTELPVRHPHIINRLAEVWPGIGATERYFDSLMLSDRKDRQGFSLAVFGELRDLLDYRLSMLPVSCGGNVWSAHPELCRGGI